MRGRSWLFLGVVVALFAATQPVWAKTVEELRKEIEAKREELKTTQEKIEEFKEEIQIKKQEARTLADQVAILDGSIGEIELSLVRTNTELETTELEIEEVEAEIDEREAEIEIQKMRLAAYIRTLHEINQQSTVAVLLKYDTFSDVIQETASVAELQQRGNETLQIVKELRAELQEKKRSLEDFRETLEALKERQEREQDTLAAQKNSKQRILDLTRAQESEYQKLLAEAQQTHKSAQADIASLDKVLREELRKRGIRSLPSVGTMDWPIEPKLGISCEFRCSGYPYAHLIGPHSAIDIPAYVGTPIKAPADGYVARTHDSGGPGYSYIMLLHGDEVTTVYGHVSGFAVGEGELVTRGTVIGYTGGAPGMRGAGLSTGPHLHFEVRKGNVPVNPRNYL